MTNDPLFSDQLSKRARLSFADDHAYSLAFAEWFGLRPQPARLLVTLYRQNTASMTIQQIGVPLAMSAGAIQRYVCDVRKALEAEAIDYHRTEGYRLTDEGMAECRAALWQMGEVLRRAS